MLKRDSLPAVFAGHSEALGPAALQGAPPPHILTGITGEIKKGETPSLPVKPQR